MYDDQVPFNLLNLQKWFASRITEPLVDEKMQLQDGVDEHIKPSQKLTANERLQIYHQQYWWRLLTTLQKNYPLLTRLFGYSDFNEEIALPYLCQNRPRHFSITELGHNLPNWLQIAYKKEDQKLVYHAALLDLAYQQLATSALSEKHLELPFDLISFRNKMLEKDVVYWQENDFPKLTKGFYRFKLLRNEQNQIVAQRLGVKGEGAC